MATPTTPDALASLGAERLQADRTRLDRIDRYVKGEHDPPYTPSSASAEYQLLAKRAVSNWLPLLVKTPAQAMAVSGYRREGMDVGEKSEEWRVWQHNRMDARQNALHRAALTYGQAFAVVLPEIAGSNIPKIRTVSPRLMYASYDDPAGDIYPKWALELKELATGAESQIIPAVLYDQTTAYELLLGGKTGPVLVSQRPHGLSHCPVVRYAPDIDLEGRVTGVVEPMIPIQDRINQTVFDLLVAQTYGSFKVRTVSGMAPEFRRDPDTGEVLLDASGRPQAIPVRADASRFLMAPDADTKFGQLDETPLGGFIDAIEMGVKHLSAVSQVPPHYLLGSLVNLGAEALAAAESALYRAVSEYEHSMGESHEAVFSLCAEIAGVEPDPAAQVVWKDTESRSLSQTVDALGKAVQMLNVPARALWARIPGTTSTDLEEWAQIAEEDDPGIRMADRMASALPAADVVTDG